MQITIERNKIHNEPQTINVDRKVLTLLGENGCGKSAILEAIFKKFSHEITSERQVISFSSGINESFSRLFESSIKEQQRFIINSDQDDVRIENSINTFYFDPSWVRLLVFAATSLKPEGKVRSLLQAKNLVVADEDDVDTSTRLKFTMRVGKQYVNRVLNALEKEKVEFDYASIRRSFFFKYLTDLIFHVNGNTVDIEAGETLRKSTFTLDAADLALVLGTDTNRLFAFLAWATRNDQFIFRNECNLRFLDHYELNSLSDGEFQLLTIYALIDLFDEDNTLYLLDEMDSHLYFENVRKLWNTFSDIDGKLITTTHSADSIIQNDFSSLKLVQNGRIESNTIANNVLERLEALSSGENYKYFLAGKVNYIVLIEDFSDWFIFRELARKKVGNFNDELIQNMHYIKCSSGYHHGGELFGNTKLDWVEKFKESNSTHLTKSIYLICDRDNLPVQDVMETGLVRNAKASNRQNRLRLNENGKHAYLMSWRRREIENYLLSYTMLENHGLLERVNDDLGRNYQLRKDDPADNDQVRRLDVKGIIQPLYQKDDIIELDTSERGLDFEKLKTIIDEIPASEISEDIENLYNFIVEKS